VREFLIKDFKTLGPLAAEPEIEEANPQKKGAKTGPKKAAALVAVEITSGSGPQVVVERAAVNKRKVPSLPEAAPRAERAPPSTRKEEEIPAPRADVKPAASKRGGQRSFIIALNGNFVGYFEADRDITSREAYLRIAQELAAADEKFELEKLELYKPVLLRGARPSPGLKVVRGKMAGFSWQKSIVAEEKAASKEK
jgi:hypothetical protein